MKSKKNDTIKEPMGLNPNYRHATSTSSLFDTSDYIVRMQSGPEGSINPSYIMSSQSFLKKISYHYNAHTILRTAVKNLWETYKYNQEYISFLLGGCNEEEFLQFAEEIAEEPANDMTKEQISFSLNLLSSIIDNELSSSDLSILLNQDCSYIEHSLLEQKYPNS